jgi:hypothetical protein
MSVIDFNRYKEDKEILEKRYLEFVPIWNKHWGVKLTSPVLFSQLYTGLRLIESVVMFVNMFGSMDSNGRKILADWMRGIIKDIENG